MEKKFCIFTHWFWIMLLFPIVFTVIAIWGGISIDWKYFFMLIPVFIIIPLLLILLSIRVYISDTTIRTTLFGITRKRFNRNELNLIVVWEHRGGYASLNIPSYYMIFSFNGEIETIANEKFLWNVYYKQNRSNPSFKAISMTLNKKCVEELLIGKNVKLINQTKIEI